MQDIYMTPWGEVTLKNAPDADLFKKAFSFVPLKRNQYLPDMRFRASREAVAAGRKLEDMMKEAWENG